MKNSIEKLEAHMLTEVQKSQIFGSRTKSINIIDEGESAVNCGFESVWNAEKNELEYTFYFQGEKEEGTVLESKLENWYF